MKTILFIEDDPEIRENFSELLRAEGFVVLAFDGCNGVIDTIAAEAPDLILLDIGLGTDSDAGLALCSEIRRIWSALPVVFFTSHDDDVDKISGMRVGADDYVTKNESLNYLVVRIKALLRRVEVLRRELEPVSDMQRRGALAMDMNLLRASWNGRILDLTLTQFWLLQALAATPGHPHDHQALMRAAKLRRVEPNTIAAHIKNIRRQFQHIDPGFSCIKTERGLGYRWVDE